MKFSHITYTNNEILIFIRKDFFMDDVRDDVIIVRLFKTNPCIFGVWHKYFDATFVITACILMLTSLAIYVAHRCRRTRDLVGVRTIVCHDLSNVLHTTAKSCIFMCNFIVRDQLASP